MKRLTYKHNDNYCINGSSGRLTSDKHANYWGEAIDRLAAYEDIEEQGKLVVLPCKIGDTVYRVMADKRIKHPYEYKVIGFWYSADETCNNVHLVRYVNGVFDSSMSVPFSEFNRILFLTKEEAEAALNNA